MNIISKQKKYLVFIYFTFTSLLFLLSFPTHLLAEQNLGLKKVIYENAVCEVGKNYWIIYDSVCPYCRSAAKYIKELDWEKKFKFISYRNPLAYKMFPNLTKEECEKDVHMVTPKGEVLAGYKVFRTVIDNLTATKIFNPLLRNEYAEKKLNEIYKKMVKERSCYYNKTGACQLEANGKGQEIKSKERGIMLKSIDNK